MAWKLMWAVFLIRKKSINENIFHSEYSLRASVSFSLTMKFYPKSNVENVISNSALIWSKRLQHHCELRFASPIVDCSLSISTPYICSTCAMPHKNATHYYNYEGEKHLRIVYLPLTLSTFSLYINIFSTPACTYSIQRMLQERGTSKWISS